MGDHNHDHEERPKVLVVVAWLDVCTPWLGVMDYSLVDGETLKGFSLLS